MTLITITDNELMEMLTEMEMFHQMVGVKEYDVDFTNGYVLAYTVNREITTRERIGYHGVPLSIDITSDDIEVLEVEMYDDGGNEVELTAQQRLLIIKKIRCNIY